MNSSDKYSRIFVKKKDKPSNFMVDLASLAKEQERLEEQERETGFINKSKDKFGTFFDKRKKEESLDFLEASDPEYEDEWEPIEKSNGRDKAPVKRTWPSIKLDDLIFVQVFGTIFSAIWRLIRSIEKVSFRLGWLVVFLVRFFYFAFLGLLRVLSKIFRPVSSIFLKKTSRKSSIWENDYKQIEPLVSQDLMDPASFAEENDLVPSNLDFLEEDSNKIKESALSMSAQLPYENLVQKNYTDEKPC